METNQIIVKEKYRLTTWLWSSLMFGVTAFIVLVIIAEQYHGFCGLFRCGFEYVVFGLGVFLLSFILSFLAALISFFERKYKKMYISVSHKIFLFLGLTLVVLGGLYYLVAIGF